MCEVATPWTITSPRAWEREGSEDRALPTAGEEGGC